MKGAPLTVPEARAILRADEALDLTYEARVAAGTTFSNEEADAWIALVDSATKRIAQWEGKRTEPNDPIVPIVPPAQPDPVVPYPGGNEPDLQTLFVEAVAAGEAKRRRE